MKKIGLLVIGIIGIGTLIGCNLKSNINDDDLLTEVQHNDIQSNRADYEAALKCIGNNIFGFDAVDIVDVYLENKGDSPLEWTIKNETEETPLISGTLEIGEKTPPSMYLLEKGSYQLSLDGDVGDEVDLQVNIRQLN